ncbi:HAMP domain-containing histidine kinase [Methylomonas sp. LL1]|nr:HAMP domain-containing histidine kinase [Methylomonas sp. LL1]
MKFKNLLSLKSLIVLGFAVAVIPLFVGVIYAAFGLRETAALGRTINSQVFEQTKTIRLVLQKSSDIERKARLFVLLSDPALRQPYERESYESARASFKQALSDLLKLHVDNKIALLVNELSEKENLIYQQIIGSETEDSFKLPIDEAFQGLRESSNTLSREFENHVEHTFNELRQLSESLEQGLLIKGLVLLAMSCAFVLALLTVLSRSMRQLDSSIRRLGSNDLQEPIEVNGPADLRYLGDRLEWLRTHLIVLESSKQQLMQNLAREIEQPLQAIREASEHLTNPLDQPELIPEAGIVQQMGTGVDKLKLVSEQLLKYSQLHAAPAPHQKQAVDMKELLETVIESFQDSIQTKSIRIKKLLRPIRIDGIPEQLRGIFEQLLTNAIHYSPANGEIRIMLRDAGEHLELEIEDDGPGIESDQRIHVFEPFYRGNKTLADQPGDNPGLGLAMVREYVTHHQGNIEFIDPRQDHQGARVRVQLPLDIEA